MNKKPIISIIVPVYNGEKTLNNCINSLISQNYKDFELIIVDNNSDDKTKEIIEKFQKENKKIKYIFEAKKGRGAARNKGIKEARGNILVMTDSDCIAPEDWICKLTKDIIEGNEKAVMGFEEDILNNYWTRNIQRSNLDFLRRHLVGDYTTSLDTKNFAIETSLIKDLKFDENLEYLEDYDLALRMRGLVKVKFLFEVKVKHLHKSSFYNWAKLQFNRAYWNAQIYKKFKKITNFENEIMMKSFDIKNNLFVFGWIIKTLINKQDNNKFFMIVSEISWKMGSIWGIINPKKS